MKDPPPPRPPIHHHHLYQSKIEGNRYFKKWKKIYVAGLPIMKWKEIVKQIACKPLVKQFSLKPYLGPRQNLVDSSQCRSFPSCIHYLKREQFIYPFSVTMCPYIGKCVACQFAVTLYCHSFRCWMFFNKTNIQNQAKLIYLFWYSARGIKIILLINCLSITTCNVKRHFPRSCLYLDWLAFG